MNFYRSLTLTLLLAMFLSTSCSNAATPNSSSSAGALTANSAITTTAARPFGRHQLNTSGFYFLNEFMRPEVRARMDEEPTGDTDGGYDPSTVDSGMSQTQEENAPAESQTEEPQAQTGDEETAATADRPDTMKFAWAKKSYADAIKASPTSSGVIVLYADEQYYDLERLTAYIEQGRNSIADSSGIGPERIQVVFGGYRATPQVELWVLRDGETLPEFKPDDRSKQDAEN